MTQQLWTEADAYIADRLLADDAVPAEVMAANRAARLPAIDVSAPQGKLLALLVRAVNARRVLEVGTLGGYSTVWMARALPADGRIVTLELDPHHAAVAHANFARVGVADRVEVRQGAALDSLAALRRDGVAPFDFVFIDADKPNNPHYLEHALALSRRGALIVVDNVVRKGAVADAASVDPSVLGTRALFDRLRADTRLDATAIQTVGDKGYDGFVLAWVK